MSDFELLERTEVRERTQHPKQYNIVFFNDDYTHMEFVILVLCEVFEYDEASAFVKMLQIHSSNKGIIATYTDRTDAHAKLDLVEVLKSQYNQPLVVDLEVIDNQ